MAGNLTTGLITTQDLRIIHTKLLEPLAYIGSPIGFDGEIKSCGIATTTESVEKSTQKLGVNLTVTLKTIAELTGSYEGTTETSQSFKRRLKKTL